MDRKSTTGYIIRVFRNVIYWRSKKQGSVTKSSTSAEYVALSDSVSEVKVILNLLNDFRIKINKPVKIYEDNSGAIAIAKYGNLMKNSKYITILLTSVMQKRLSILLKLSQKIILRIF